MWYCYRFTAQKVLLTGGVRHLHLDVCCICGDSLDELVPQYHAALGTMDQLKTVACNFVNVRMRGALLTIAQERIAHDCAGTQLHAHPRAIYVTYKSTLQHDADEELAGALYNDVRGKLRQGTFLKRGIKADSRF